MQRLVFASLVALAECKTGTKNPDTAENRIEVVVMPATYASHSDAPPDVIKKCKFERAVAEAIVKATPGSTFSTGTASKSLEMEVVSMRGVEPTWEGESRVIVRGKLLDGGMPVGTFRIKSSAHGGVMGGMKGICKALDTIAGDMGESVSDWLREPKMDTELGD